MKKLALFSLCALGLGCGGGGGDTTPIPIALLAPNTGPLQSVGTSFTNMFKLAVDNINNSGGINGRMIDDSIILDTQLAVTNGPPCHQTFQNAVDMGAVAVVGPAASGELTDCYPTAATDKVPVMSPSSTAPSLSQRPLNPDDQGYMFRDVPDDSVQTKVIAHYLSDVVSPAVNNVAVVYEDSPYGSGLEQAFVGKFTATATNTADIKLQYCQGFPTNPSSCGASDITTAQGVIDQLTTAMNNAANPPTTILLVSLEQDALAITDAWDASTDPVLKSAQFFFVDGAHTQGFLDGAADSISGMCGTTPTYPTNSVSYTYLQGQYATAYPTGDLNNEAYGPNVWDAVHLFAAAMLQQAADHPDEPIGGPDLRDEITTVSKDGQTVNAGSWRTIISDIQNGTNVDFDGASGPQDFANNQTISPYEVWCVQGTGTNKSFSQALFLDASQVEAL